MVVQGILALALALPTGLLFGVGYGTGVRIGYEQVYPLLFPQDKDNRNVTPTVNNIKQINGIYNAIGGKEASQMGIAMGLQGAMEEIDRNPDFQALEALELRLSGRTQSRLETDSPSKETSISDFPSGLSLDPNSPKIYAKDKDGNTIIPLIQIGGFNEELYIFIKKEKQDADFPPDFDFGNKEDLNKYNITGTTDPPTGTLYKSLTKNIEQAQSFTAWDKIKIETIQSFLSNKAKMLQKYNAYIGEKRGSSFVIAHRKEAKRFRGYAFNQRGKLKQMSNDYRNPNNGIRTAALQLRRDLQFMNTKGTYYLRRID